MTFNVLVPDAHHRDLEVERGVTGDLVDYVIHDETDAASIPEAEWRSCDAVLVWHRMRITADVVAMLDACKLIVRVGVGFDNVDVAACKARGITVSNVPNYGTTEVADHGVALMLYLIRGLGTYEKRLKANPVTGFVAEGVPVVRRIRGATFGAVGMGRIGTALVRRAAALDMKPIYHDPYLPEGHDLGVGVERVHSLEALLEQADVVSIHTPLNDETRAMVNDDFLAAMKPGAVLINIARGGLVDLDAVERALRSGRLEAAGLDVLPQEPPVPEPPLISAWRAEEDWLAGRFILTPHAAFYSEAGYVDMRTFSAEILIDRLVHGRTRNDVTR
ncbi:C-terminal binding protein [Nitratireductor aquimarinus]|uniref:C-terminal binding protein n=1 Tax=Nitratireductor TaxID=245876 RepID=UPI0019D40E96|nr:C-terminal binding protein [Nitratireductor aquimarinus]MBN7776623.1 C-terminal binding protein [Nitratireductor pacificus]MBN7779490.1 C-terminal binding protein [Nitratireductor pacificus]MBN7788297.1 C-terminal binding protein [Nitratireductor aquimarinus]MBY6098344.1 C-terminal binding protein [Nitratireductor aquimarinus]MCA1261028.1 C-terminal binding protein [Nitratireductor aquimarinus]